MLPEIFGLFAGFAVGRFGDKLGGHLNTFHHWIWGLLLIFLGAYFYSLLWGALAIFFGVGLVISDLDDFLHFRVYGVDEPHEWRFWSIK